MTSMTARRRLCEVTNAAIVTATATTSAGCQVRTASAAAAPASAQRCCTAAYKAIVTNSTIAVFSRSCNCEMSEQFETEKSGCRGECRWAGPEESTP